MNGVRWRAIAHCWDSFEGIIPDFIIDGIPLPSTAIYRSPDTFDTFDQALDWAYAHDIDTDAAQAAAWVAL